MFDSVGGLPEINMANSCNAADNGTFEGTSLAKCQDLAADIATCQDKGKIVTLSLGGATGGSIFADDAAGEAFAQTIWDLFFEGTSETRPFGDAVLDGYAILPFLCKLRWCNIDQNSTVLISISKVVEVLDLWPLSKPSEPCQMMHPSRTKNNFKFS